ncbi:response regulator [Patescibacteria group bacterium]|nr:response regulator [Patescibacteria group bacterium]
MAEKKKFVLLIEDEQTIANLIQLRLEKAGYIVQTEKNGKVALTLIPKLKPDLILLDLMLPGLGGFDIMEALSKDHILPDMPIVVISNSGQPVEIERALNLGVRDYLIKVNFSPDEVLEKVNQVIAAGKTRKEKKRTKKLSATPKGILLVEDDLILSDVLERKFMLAKQQVFKALSANEARIILKKEKIDIILLDLVLPDVDGFTFLEELKHEGHTKNIPVIILSNLGQRQEIDRGINAGADDYIVKSNTVPEEILKKVEALLKKGQNKN